MAGHLDVLWTSALDAAAGSAYDRFVDAAAGGHFAQARPWAKVAAAGRHFKVRYFLAREADRVIGSALVLRPSVGPLVLPAAIVERGPVCARREDLPRVLAAFARAARARGIARLTVMPYWAGAEAKEADEALALAGFHDVQALDGAHATTLRIDLAKSDDALCAGRERSNLRHSIKNAERAGAVARRATDADMPIFERLYGEVMDPQRRTTKPRAWFAALGELVREGSRAALFVCDHENEAIGAAIVCRLGPMATLAFAATTSAPRSISKLLLPLMAAIRWARAEGCATFDLGGVPPEDDPDTKRRDIAKFKLHFTKDRISLVHEHARWF